MYTCLRVYVCTCVRVYVCTSVRVYFPYEFGIYCGAMMKAYS